MINILRRTKILSVGITLEPLEAGCYWVDTNTGLKYTILADNTTVSVTKGSSTASYFANGLTIPSTVNDKNMLVYDSNGQLTRNSNYTYNVVLCEQAAFFNTGSLINGGIVIGENVTTLNSQFYGQGNSYAVNTSITFVIYPMSLTSIGNGVGNRCTAVKLLDLGGYKGNPTGGVVPGGLLNTSIRLIVARSTTPNVGNNQYNLSSSIDHTVRIVYPSVESVLSPYTDGDGSPFGQNRDAVELYVPDSLVSAYCDATKWKNIWGASNVADHIKSLSSYTVSDDYPSYNSSNWI